MNNYRILGTVGIDDMTHRVFKVQRQYRDDELHELHEWKDEGFDSNDAVVKYSPYTFQSLDDAESFIRQIKVERNEVAWDVVINNA